MLNLKKFLSLSLSMALIFNSIVPMKSEAFIPEELESSCAKKNSKGGYIEDSCAYWDAENVLLNEKKDYVVIKNLGPLADRTFYYFSFNALDKILDVINQPTEELQQEIDKLAKKKNSLKESVLSRISLSGVIGAVGGHLSARLFDWYRKVLYNKEKKRRSKKDIKATPAKLMLYAGKGIFELIGAALVGILSACYLSSEHINLNDEISKINEEKNRIDQYKSCALGVMLDDIKKAQYKDEDYFIVNAFPDDCWLFGASSMGLNYTEAQRKAFEPKFQKLEKDLEDALKDEL